MLQTIDQIGKFCGTDILSINRDSDRSFRQIPGGEMPFEGTATGTNHGRVDPEIGLKRVIIKYE